MSEVTFTLSAFGDEIAVDLEDQLRVLGDLQIDHLDLRQAWGKNVLHLDDDEVDRVAALCGECGVSVSSIGSPIGKSPLEDPIEMELGNLARIFEICEKVGASKVRIFSFYPPDTSTNAHYDDYIQESISRLAQLAELAQRDGYTLMLENEKAIVGDTVDRCRALVSTVDSPHLSFLWDPANFIQVGQHPYEECLPLLKDYIEYFHIKDAELSTGAVKPAGEGDGKLAQILSEVIADGFEGFLSIEPHLKMEDRKEAFHVAASALKKLLDEIGAEYD